MKHPWLDETGLSLWHRIEQFIARGVTAARDDALFESLAMELVAWQQSRCPAIDRVVRAFHSAGRVSSLNDVPGVPTDVFKYARVACFAPEHTQRVFHTSGTTRDVRGSHEFADTSLYTLTALQGAARDLLPGRAYRFVLLAPSESEAHDSSLSFMLARFHERWSVDGCANWMIERGVLMVEQIREILHDACVQNTPVALLGTSFGFVHLVDALNPGEVLPLPQGSVVMPTGGFKGRSRELAPEDLFALIVRAFAVDRAQIVQEYGMTELSSQAYEHTVSHGAGRYVPAPWMSVSAVDPVTLERVAYGEQGLLRIVDLANVGSAAVIQTADMATVFGDQAFCVHGRLPGATPRGCARAMDAVLSGDE